MFPSPISVAPAFGPDLRLRLGSMAPALATVPRFDGVRIFVGWTAIVIAALPRFKVGSKDE
jgi:hypothetical protein